MNTGLRRSSTAPGHRRPKLIGTALATILIASLAGCGSMGSKSATSAATVGREGSLLELANAMAAQGDYNAAIPLYRGAHAQNSGSAPLIGLGRSLVAIGQYIEAEAVFQKAVDADDDNPDALAGLGMAYLALGQAAAADPLFSKALAASPSHEEALRGKALAADLLGRHDEAHDVYGRALANGSNDVRLQNNYGLSQALHGDTEGGIATLEEVVRNRGGGVAVRQNLALAYALAGERDKAENLLRVDLDGERVARQMAFFASLGGMSPDDRLYALMNGGKLPQRDLKEPAFEQFADEKHEQDAAIQVVGLPEDLTKPDVFAEVPEEAEVAAAEPEPAPQPAPHEDADLTSIPLLDSKEGWALQLAAYRKASQLIAGWEQLKTANEDIIGHLPPRRTEIDFGDRTDKPHGFYYRLNAGPLTNKAEAEELCAKLADRGTDCWVRPPEANEGKLPTQTAAALTE